MIHERISPPGVFIYRTLCKRRGTNNFCANECWGNLGERVQILLNNQHFDTMKENFAIDISYTIFEVKI